jgi:predicted O-methyltransferase YrrM
MSNAPPFCEETPMQQQHPGTQSAPLETPRLLAERFESGQPGIVYIKPKILFLKTEALSVAPSSMNIYLPPSGIGSITLLEASALVALTKIIEPKVIFEFGTFLGYSTALFLKNSSPECRVISVDLGDVAEEVSGAAHYSEAELRKDDRKNDNHLRLVQSKQGPYYLKGLTEIDQARLTLIHQDSRSLNVKGNGLEDQVDLVFVDGGHDLETIVSDSGLAKAMIGEDGVIVWHDFNSQIHGDVTRYIDGASKQDLILSIPNTMLAIGLYGKARARFLELGCTGQDAA